MALILDLPMQDDAASSVVVAAVGSNASIGGNTQDISIPGPGGNLLKAFNFPELGGKMVTLASPISFAANSGFGIFAKASATLPWRLADNAAGTSDFFDYLNSTETIRIYDASAVQYLEFDVTGLNTTVWHHYYVDFYSDAGSEAARLYIDGVLTDTASNASCTFPFGILLIESGTSGVTISAAGFRCYTETRTAAQILADKELGLPPASVAYFATSIDNHLATSPTGDYLSLFSTFLPTVEDGSVYNTNLWGGDGHVSNIAGWTGIIWYETGIGTGHGVAITKRHVLVTEHGTHTQYSTAHWILADGSLVTRVFIDAITFIGPSGSGPGSRFRLLLLDADLPATVPITRMLDPDLYGMIDLLRTPVVAFDAELKVRIGEITIDPYAYLRPSSRLIAYWDPQHYDNQTGTTDNPARDQYWEETIGGDSGSPCFLLYGNELIYLSNATFLSGPSNALATLGPSALGCAPFIIAAVQALNAEYSLSDNDYAPSFIDITSDFTPTPPIAAHEQMTRVSLGLGLNL